MKSSSNLFKQSLEKAYINDPTISKDIDVVSDLDKYSDEMTENEETTEATGAASAGAFSAPLFAKEETKEEEKIPGGLSKNKTLKKRNI